MHDFSYAGYRYGAALPAAPPGGVFDAVATFGADNAGLTDATPSIQSAIDAASAAGGGVVFLPAGLYRCDGVLVVTASRVVLRGAGSAATRVYFTKVQGMSGVSHITLRGSIARSADLPLAKDGENRSKVVAVTQTTGLSVGDEIAVGWVITPDFVAEHGMTGVWTQFNGQWRPFFRRTIIAIDAAATPPTVTLDVPLRYPARLRDQASVRRETGYLAEGGIEHLSVSNAVGWSDAWSQNQVHAISIESAEDSWVRDVGTFASPLAQGSGPGDNAAYHLQSGGVRVADSKRVTVSSSNMQGAQNRGSGGNGYLYEITQSNEVLVADSVARSGRHNFIQNWDFGTSGCVLLRSTSAESRYVTMILGVPVESQAYSEFHHSLAMANLIDACTLSDGWLSRNRGTESSGAGHTSTQSVVWNASGGGRIASMQYGWGYVIGASPGMTVDTSLASFEAVGTAPEDFVEGAGMTAPLWPPSLYEEQRARRLMAP